MINFSNLLVPEITVHTFIMREREMMYKLVVQTEFLYGSKSWLVMDDMLKVLEGFHHRVDRSIAEIPGWRVREEGWD